MMHSAAAKFCFRY